MKLEEAREIVMALVEGFDQLTGEVLPSDIPYNRRTVKRALRIVYYETATKQEQTNFSRNIVGSKITKIKKQEKNLKEGKPKNAGMPWTDSLRKKLVSQYQRGVTIAKLSKTFERTQGAIRSELIKQNEIVED